MLRRLAPSFPKDFVWLNVARPLSLEKDLRGRFVLLDFWTYCCINCMHVLPELKNLEREFPELVVIGVHSAKFYNEQTVDNVRAAIVRYDIEHPVILDEDYHIWRLYDAHAWPTFVVIDPMGQLLWRSSGEGIDEALRPRLLEWRAAYAQYLRLEPLPLRLEKYQQPEALLSFPGKLAVDTQGCRLFLSDSNHNRILVVRPSGEVLVVIGSGDEGRRDGPFAEATFYRPQGLVYVAAEDALYVADTENHLIRRVDLQRAWVETIAGTGQQARRLYREGPALEIPLNSPWDIAWQEGKLIIAMAGFHQLWQLDPAQKRIQVWVGSGMEDLRDGHRLVSALAQPSGLTVAPDGRVYFADSESSAIRYVEGDQVKTLIGEGLFTFGDRDGSFAQALLQHPIGLTWQDGALWVADTYNHKIRRIDLERRHLETVLGTGQRGYRDGTASEALFSEPNDIKALDGFFYITDTNNHQLRVWDPRRNEVATLEVGPIRRLITRRPVKRFSLWNDGMRLAPILVKSQEPIRLRFRLPSEFKCNEEAPSWIAFQEKVLEMSPAEPTLLEVVLAPAGANSLQLGVYVCPQAGTQCYLWTYTQPVEYSPNGATEVEVSLPVQA